MFENIDKNNLHHAYLIEGDSATILPEVLEFVSDNEIIQINLDTFKIDDARNLKSLSIERGYNDRKKFYIISVNSFLLEAQNALLKMFEEPIENTHFIVVVPDVSALLPTFVSRFYSIYSKQNLDIKEAEQFIAMPALKRVEWIKGLLADEDLARARASKFLNALEIAVHNKKVIDPDLFHHVFEVREFLRMPGTSVKSLMESVALVVPTSL